jgi:hypothetical protein
MPVRFNGKNDLIGMLILFVNKRSKKSWQVGIYLILQSHGIA